MGHITKLIRFYFLFLFIFQEFWTKGCFRMTILDFTPHLQTNTEVTYSLWPIVLIMYLEDSQLTSKTCV